MPQPTPEHLGNFARQLFGKLDQLSYHELLGISSTASIPEVRAAFYRLSNDLHPDRYHVLADQELKERLETIYARICEAYRVLSTPEKRAAYAIALSEGKRRLTSTGRDSKAPQNPEDSIKHEEAKKFFRLGMICLGRKDYKGAVMNFNFARSFEPDAAIINQKLGEAQAGLPKAGAPGAK